mmetsp:Transcript_1137/g.3507  ORF Transcript_1137/g.3507 Transcript_1137/m.3507 type:complete len:315 (-) Transcript_1137:1671-2615(-)
MNLRVASRLSHGPRSTFDLGGAYGFGGPGVFHQSAGTRQVEVVQDVPSHHGHGRGTSQNLIVFSPGQVRDAPVIPRGQVVPRVVRSAIKGTRRNKMALFDEDGREIAVPLGIRRRICSSICVLMPLDGKGRVYLRNLGGSIQAIPRLAGLWDDSRPRVARGHGFFPKYSVLKLAFLQKVVQFRVERNVRHACRLLGGPSKPGGPLLFNHTLLRDGMDRPGFARPILSHAVNRSHRVNAVLIYVPLGLLSCHAEALPTGFRRPLSVLNGRRPQRLCCGDTVQVPHQLLKGDGNQTLDVGRTTIFRLTHLANDTEK